MDKTRVPKPPPVVTDKHLKATAPAGTADRINETARLLFGELKLMHANLGYHADASERQEYCEVTGMLARDAKRQFEALGPMLRPTRTKCPMWRWLNGEAQDRIGTITSDLHAWIRQEHGPAYTAYLYAERRQRG